MYTDYNEKVEVYVCVRDFKSRAKQNDLQVRCYLQEGDQWNFVSETEIAEDNLEPNFSTPFTLVFYFEIKQPIRFEIVNVYYRNSIEVLGVAETTLGSIMGARRQTASYPVKKNEVVVPGQIITQAEKVGNGVDFVFWQWKAIKLVNTIGRGAKSDPFLRFYKLRPGGDAIKVHETEFIEEDLNPVWKPFEIPASKLCYEDNQPFRIECWDWEKAGKYQFIGSCEVSIEMLEKGTTDFTLQNPNVKGKTGTLRVSDYVLQSQASFIDYVRGGVQLNAVVAIDFTGSNGDPRFSTSLHALLPDGHKNEYQKAISAVCEIILNYDSDQLVPIYGFGAKPHFPTMDMKVVSHCFPCTGTVDQHQVYGLQGIMDVYAHALKHCEFAGPTFFTPLIREAMSVSKIHKETDQDIYSILLILTDGEIHDMDKCIDTIVECSDLPLSIIIIGVGKADFTNMVILDGDKGLSNSKGKKAVRDSVQFVPFRDFNGDMEMLAKDVLAEVPDQLIKYMKMVGKRPKAPKLV